MCPAKVMRTDQIISGSWGDPEDSSISTERSLLEPIGEASGVDLADF